MTIKWKAVDKTDSITEVIEEREKQLGEFYRVDLQKAHFEVSKHLDVFTFKARIPLKKETILTAEASDVSYSKAIHQAFDKLERQAVKIKTKHTKHNATHLSELFVVTE